MKMLAVALGVGALLSLLFTARSAMTRNVAVALVRVPQGGIQPEAAVDSHGTLHLLYFAGEPRGGNLFYVRSTDYGQTFSTPLRVNSQEGSAITTGAIRGGQLAVGHGGRVHVVWNGSDGAKPRGLVNPASGKAEAPFLYSRSGHGKLRARCISVKSIQRARASPSRLPLPATEVRGNILVWS